MWLLWSAAMEPSQVGPISLGDVLNSDVHFPVYSVDPDREQYGSLHTTYYYWEGQSDADHITTSFTMGDEDNEMEIARLRISSLCSPPLVQGGIGLSLEEQVEVRWASVDSLDGAWTFPCKSEVFNTCLW